MKAVASRLKEVFAAWAARLSEETCAVRMVWGFWLTPACISQGFHRVSKRASEKNFSGLRLSK